MLIYRELDIIHADIQCISFSRSGSNRLEATMLTHWLGCEIPEGRGCPLSLPSTHPGSHHEGGERGGGQGRGGSRVGAKSTGVDWLGLHLSIASC